MFYTLIMAFVKKHSSILLIIGGLTLIIGGIIGGIVLSQPNPNIGMKGRYRYEEKNILTSPDFQATITPPPYSSIQNGNLDTNSPTISRVPILEPFHTFIHTSVGDLENPAIPDKIEIPSINLIAPVVIADFNLTKVQGETFGQWVAPSKFAAGWHPDSALLGKNGNTVIDGHHNEFGEVFGNLINVNIGDIIIVYSGSRVSKFVVANKLILAERFQTTQVRLDNARWLARTDDLRLTLVTCYPKESNTHRLIIVARPLVSN
jgi:LPXTG-site transpeptidase (sortase) family protein